jgi:shikimate kinase
VAVLDALAHGGIVSLGGGAVTTTAVRTALAGLPVVWLTMGEHKVPSHAGKGGRPLLDGPDPQASWRRLAAQRAPLYAGGACLRVDRTGSSAPDTAAAIAVALNWPEMGMRA